MSTLHKTLLIFVIVAALVMLYGQANADDLVKVFLPQVVNSQMGENFLPTSAPQPEVTGTQAATATDVATATTTVTATPTLTNIDKFFLTPGTKWCQSPGYPVPGLPPCDPTPEGTIVWCHDCWATPTPRP